ncbi:MAG: hypothetical protein AAF393_00730 [Pseudomonadota bacterium]
MNKIYLVAALAAISGCVPASPVVSNFNGDSVTIVTSTLTERNQALAASQQEANRICQKGQKKRAEYASTRTNAEKYEDSHLYLCLN